MHRRDCNLESRRSAGIAGRDVHTSFGPAKGLTATYSMT